MKFYVLYLSILQRIKYSFFSICFLSSVVTVFSQNITIKGKAHLSHAGKIICAYAYQDYITKLKMKMAVDTIDSDGYFELKMYSKYTKPLMIQINNYVGQIHVKPDYVYGILFPEIDESFKHIENAELPVNISIIGHDTTELNMLILDYERLYNYIFTPKNNEFLTHRKLFKRADTLKVVCDQRFAGIKDKYFINYYNYKIASINASLSRGEKFLISNFISNKPILYNNYEYMTFFSACFSNYLNSLGSSKKGLSLYKIINVNASLQQLHEFCKEDPFLQNDSLRELVIIQNLWNLYYNPEFSKEAIKSLVSQINISTKNEEHKALTDYMLASFYHMQAGKAAPFFLARNRAGNIESLEKFKGKWIYLNFFSTKNPESMKEMGKIDLLRKKYGDKVVFVSVNLDDSIGIYQKYLKDNPKYNWPIWYNQVGGLKQTARELYSVVGTEAYFLIDSYGTLALSPADSPSKGIEYKLNDIFKPARKKTKTGIR